MYCLSSDNQYLSCLLLISPGFRQPWCSANSPRPWWQHSQVLLSKLWHKIVSHFDIVGYFGPRCNECYWYVIDMQKRLRASILFQERQSARISEIHRLLKLENITHCWKLTLTVVRCANDITLYLVGTRASTKNIVVKLSYWPDAASIMMKSSMLDNYTRNFLFHSSATLSVPGYCHYDDISWELEV